METTKRTTEYLPATITKNQAMYLLKTIWPDAPEVEVIKAGILCQQYGLNPLMRQVYLVQFSEEWVTILGIKATRQIAQQALRKRGIRYSYSDGPRFMNDEEQKKIRGKVEAGKLWAITILKDGDGNLYPGYGFWPADKKPYGTDKGNDPLNMAFIRSERNALDKLAPGELPDIDVGDDAYIQGDYRLALERGKLEFTAGVEKEVDELWPDDKRPVRHPDKKGQIIAPPKETVAEPPTEAALPATESQDDLEKKVEYLQGKKIAGFLAPSLMSVFRDVSGRTWQEKLRNLKGERLAEFTAMVEKKAKEVEGL